jgi:hypothetical protein
MAPGAPARYKRRMRIRLVLLIGFATLSAASAETLRLPATEQPQASKTLPLKGAGSAARAASCASYGRGFMWVESAATCVKIGGSLSVDTTIRR